MQEPDQEMIKAIARGDREVFRQVFHACYEGLCQYACTLLKDMDEAEDTVQTLLLKVWEKRETLDIRITLRAYLYRAVYNQCLNQLEHRVIRLKHQSYQEYEMASAVQSPEVFPEELEEKIRAAVHSLPTQCRIIFMMSRYDELKYGEIAARLNISVNTVENQISKALRILRTKLKD